MRRWGNGVRHRGYGRGPQWPGRGGVSGQGRQEGAGARAPGLSGRRRGDARNQHARLQARPAFLRSHHDPGQSHDHPGRAGADLAFRSQIQLLRRAACLDLSGQRDTDHLQGPRPHLPGHRAAERQGRRDLPLLCRAGDAYAADVPGWPLRPADAPPPKNPSWP